MNNLVKNAWEISKEITKIPVKYGHFLIHERGYCRIRGNTEINKIAGIITHAESCHMCFRSRISIEYRQLTFTIVLEDLLHQNYKIPKTFRAFVILWFNYDIFFNFQRYWKMTKLRNVSFRQITIKLCESSLTSHILTPMLVSDC